MDTLSLRLAGMVEAIARVFRRQPATPVAPEGPLLPRRWAAIGTSLPSEAKRGDTFFVLTDASLWVSDGSSWFSADAPSEVRATNDAGPVIEAPGYIARYELEDPLAGADLVYRPSTAPAPTVPHTTLQPVATPDLFRPAPTGRPLLEID